MAKTDAVIPPPPLPPKPPVKEKAKVENVKQELKETVAAKTAVKSK
jgi:hypothetical protein